jgi:voltage-gated potassium channel
VTYLRGNVLKLVGLLLPAVRVLRVFGLARAARLAGAGRGLRLARVLSTSPHSSGSPGNEVTPRARAQHLNRSMGAFGSTMRRRGFGYVVGTTVIVTLAGAADMYAFENGGANGNGLPSFGSALWWK